MTVRPTKSRKKEQKTGVLKMVSSEDSSASAEATKMRVSGSISFRKNPYEIICNIAGDVGWGRISKSRDART